MLCRAADVHGYATRLARLGSVLTSRDHQLVGYRVPREWASVGETLRGVGSIGAFKRGSRAGFLSEYAAFRCGVAECFVCRVDES